jgi:3-methyl-2-oxobutanoate hydroxymethyltransferase
MSAHPEQPAGAGGRAPVTLPQLAEMKLNAEPIVMVTAYDYPSAEIAEAAGVDLVLVGDTAAMTVLGHTSTTPVSMDEMLVLAKAVRRGLRTPLLVGDLPFGSYERSNDQAIETAMRYVKEAGCDVVKLERGGSSVERARAIVLAGIPVMGHVGLTPQTATALGGYRAQGKTADQAVKIAEEALALQAAGCFAIVFEAVPAAISEVLVAKLSVPVIGIGAGAGTDGQVLVWHDLLGIYGGHTAKFVKRYAELREEMVDAVGRYAGEVRARSFPGPEHTYSIEAEELDAFRRYLDHESLAASDPFGGDWSATEI